MRKIFNWALMISFVILTLSTIGLLTPFGRELIGLHKLSGWIFIFLTVAHIYIHRASYKYKKHQK